jgi:plasmid stabilization system protein ParE
VVLQPPALIDIAEAHAYIEIRSPIDADRWLAGLQTAIADIGTFPRGYPLARESGRSKRELRQMVYGRGLRAYRVVFTIEGEEVHVLHVRRAARRRMRRP